MAQSLLITLREGLEVALILVIVLSYLRKTGRFHLAGRVWWGVGGAAATSLLAGGVLILTGRQLEGRAEEIFEGVAMLAAVGVLTWMIIWMKSQARQIRGQLEESVERAVRRGSGLALVVLAFVAVVREGLETVLFLFGAAQTATGLQTAAGAVVGLGASAVLGVLLYRGGTRLNLRLFFNVTGVLLILFAAGLLASGVYELQEAGVFPVVMEGVWDTSGLLSDKSVAGSFLKSLFGYQDEPSLLQVLLYPAYLAAAMSFFLGPVRTRRLTPARMA